MNIEKVADLEISIREAQLKINNINTDGLDIDPVEKFRTQAENN